MNQTTEKNVAKAILPGGTIGMVGGGQLGRMFAIAAAQMGYRVGIFCGSTDEPACAVAAFHVCGPLDDHSAIESFAKQCDVITLEFENIPADTIAACGRHAPTYPNASVLATAQDRILEKSTLRDAGLPVTPFASVHDGPSTIAAAASLGWPLIVKTCRSGYDGKGQHRLSKPEDTEHVDWEAGGDWIAEAMIPFQREASVVVARNVHGETSTLPVFENIHVNHILDTTILPARVSPEIESRAKAIAIQAAQTLDVVGLLCVELFLVSPDDAGDGDSILINEVAPRPHNSGHVTIESSYVSQFEQHVRAVCGLPLGDSSLRTPAAAMVNLLGDVWDDDGCSPDWAKALQVPGVSLHLYAKHAARPGRKMGHMTTTGPSIEDCLARLDQARTSLE